MPGVCISHLVESFVPLSPQMLHLDTDNRGFHPPTYASPSVPSPKTATSFHTNTSTIKNKQTNKTCRKMSGVKKHEIGDCIVEKIHSELTLHANKINTGVEINWTLGADTQVVDLANVQQEERLTSFLLLLFFLFSLIIFLFPFPFLPNIQLPSYSLTSNCSLTKFSLVPCYFSLFPLLPSFLFFWLTYRNYWLYPQ